MKLTEFGPLTEAKPSQTCPKCGQGPMAKTHTYGGRDASGNTVWKCKAAAIKAASSTPATTPAPTPAPTPVAAASEPEPPAAPKATATSTEEPPNEHARIRAFFKKYSESDNITSNVSEENIKINPDGSVDILSSFTMDEFDGDKFPVKINSVKGTFHFSVSKIKTLENLPMHVEHSYFIDNCSNIVNLDHAPQTVGATFSVKYCSKLSSLATTTKRAPIKCKNVNLMGLPALTSLEDIDMVFQAEELTVQGLKNLTGNIVPIVEIKGIKKVELKSLPKVYDDNTSRERHETLLKHAFDVANKCIEAGKDSILFQDDLLQAGSQFEQLAGG